MSTSAHIVLSNQQFLTKKGMTPMPHSPYSPNFFQMTVFCLFPWMKKVLKGEHFASVEEVKQTNKQMAKPLKGIKICEFKNCSEQWEKMAQQVYCIKWKVV